MQSSKILLILSIASLSACQAKTNQLGADHSSGENRTDVSSRGKLVSELQHALGAKTAGRRVVADDPFRVWPRALAGDLPFGWGVRADDLQMIDSPIGGGLGQRMELRTAGRFTIRMQPPPGKYLFLRCSVEPSSMGDPNQPNLVQWEARFDGGQPPARGAFSRDPQSNYWTAATSNLTTGNSGYVEITSPSGPEPIWAIGFCDVLPFELAPPN